MRKTVKSIQNRQFLLTAFSVALIVLVFMVIGCAQKPAADMGAREASKTEAKQEPPAETPKTPIKIGIMYPLTGPYAWLGTRQLRGWELVFEQVGYKINGRPVEFIREDTAGDPKVAVTKVTKLIEKDKVHILGGIVSSAEALAIRDIVDRAGVPLVITMANAGEITRQLRSPYIFRTFPAGGTGSYYMARYIFNNLGKKTAVFSGVDYAYGHEHAELFKKEFERLGGKVLFENFAPYGTTNFAPYVAALARYAGKADVLYFVYSGTDADAFVKALEAYGLNKKFILANWGATTDGSALAQQGAAAEGIYLVSTYNFDLKYDANRRFIELAKKKGGQVWIDVNDAYGYVGAQVVLHALEQIGGKVEDREALLKALREVKFEAPMGPFEFDPRSQNVLPNLFISQVKKVDGEFGERQNVVLFTFEKVQDPWWIEHSGGKG